MPGPPGCAPVCAAGGSERAAGLAGPGRAAASAAAIVSSTRRREIMETPALKRLQKLNQRSLIVVGELGAKHVTAIQDEVWRLIAANQSAEERAVRQDVEDRPVLHDGRDLARIDARDQVDRRAGGNPDRPI